MNNEILKLHFIKVCPDIESFTKQFVNAFRKLDDDDVHIITHGDPDGITAGAIIYKLLKIFGIKPHIHIPPGFLVMPESLKDLSGKLLMIIDRGTLSSYSQFYKNFDKIFVIDHHPYYNKVSYNALNPNLNRDEKLCASLLAFGVKLFAHSVDELDELLCLIGLTGDFAHDGIRASVYLKRKTHFASLFKPVKSYRTMFDLNYRGYSKDIHKITELLFAITGGGFDFYYTSSINKKPSVYAAFESIVSIKEPNKVSSFEQFMANIKYKKQYESIYKSFRKDFETELLMLRHSFLIHRDENISVFVFVAMDMKLLPVLIGIFMADKKKEVGDREVVFFGINVGDGKIAISGRSIGDNFHCGKFCYMLSRRLLRDIKDKIYEAQGGGHKNAAECNIMFKNECIFDILVHIKGLLGEFPYNKKSK